MNIELRVKVLRHHGLGFRVLGLGVHVLDIWEGQEGDRERREGPQNGQNFGWGTTRTS